MISWYRWAVLYCTVLHCTVLLPRAWWVTVGWFPLARLPVSPCTAPYIAPPASSLDYVITLPTTTTAQGAGGDIPPHSCRWRYTAHFRFLFNPFTTFFRHTSQTLDFSGSYLPLSCTLLYSTHQSLDVIIMNGSVHDVKMTISPPAGQHLSSAAGWAGGGTSDG